MPLLPKDFVDFPTLNEFMLTGEIRIPEFQRAMIWQAESVENLLDSITEGYPIGFFLFWTSQESLQERTPHPLYLKLRKLKRHESKYWLLDGQQRATAIVGSFNDKLFLGKGKNNKHRAFFDLKDRKFKVLRISDIERKNPKPENIVQDWFIPLNKLFLRDKKTGAFVLAKEKYLQANPEVLKNYGEHYNNEILHLERMFSNLTIPIINEKKHLAEACEIFTRLNTAGTPLGIVDIMVAKTYKADFLLRNKIEDFNAELFDLNFELRDTTILQCMAACITESPDADAILNHASEIRAEWDNTANAIKNAVYFLKNRNVCKFSKFLPHEILLAPLSYFFYKRSHLDKKPQSGVEQDKALERFFWYNTLSEKYVRSQNTKAKDDIKQMNSLLNDNFNVFKHDDYDFAGLSEKEFKREELASTPFAKTVLCFLISKKPKNYNNNTDVEIEKAINPQNLKSMHHVFPKVTYPDKHIDSVANISIIATSLNNAIKHERPKTYFAKFALENPDLQKTLREHHLIGDLTNFGINEDKVDTFLEKRSALIKQEMRKLMDDLKPSRN